MRRVRAIEPDIEAGELARRTAQGRRTAQRDLFQRLASPIHDTLYYILGSNEQMEGVLENAFVEIFRALSAFDRKCDLNTWACAIAIRVVCRQLRDAQREAQPVAEAASRLECAGFSEADAARGVGLEQVYALLRRLEPEQHVALALFMMGRRSVDEIAALTDVDAAVVRERISLARGFLCATARGDEGLMASIAVHARAE